MQIRICFFFATCLHFSSASLSSRVLTMYRSENHFFQLCRYTKQIRRQLFKIFSYPIQCQTRSKSLQHNQSNSGQLRATHAMNVNHGINKQMQPSNKDLMMYMVWKDNVYRFPHVTHCSALLPRAYRTLAKPPSSAIFFLCFFWPFCFWIWSLFSGHFFSGWATNIDVESQVGGGKIPHHPFGRSS